MADSGFVHIIQHYQLLWVSAIHSSGYEYVQDFSKESLNPTFGPPIPFPNHMLVNAEIWKQVLTVKMLQKSTDHCSLFHTVHHRAVSPIHQEIRIFPKF